MDNLKTQQDENSSDSITEKKSKVNLEESIKPLGDENKEYENRKKEDLEIIPEKKISKSRRAPNILEKKPNTSNNAKEAAFVISLLNIVVQESNNIEDGQSFSNDATLEMTTRTLNEKKKSKKKRARFIFVRKFLPTLMIKTLQPHYLKNDLLTTLKKLIEPFRDDSLPNTQVVKDVFKVLDRMAFFSRKQNTSNLSSSVKMEDYKNMLDSVASYFGEDVVKKFYRVERIDLDEVFAKISEKPLKETDFNKICKTYLIESGIGPIVTFYRKHGANELKSLANQLTKMWFSLLVEERSG